MGIKNKLKDYYINVCTQKLNIDKEDKILVVAPHPDDETLGAGGLLALYDHCDVIVVTDGRMGNPEWNADKTARVREKELEEAMEAAGVKKVYRLGFHDSRLRGNERLSGADIRKYDYIFLPGKYENHPDHTAVNKIFRHLAKSQNRYCPIYEYEIWTPLRNPTHYLDISKYVQKKKDMISKYKCQLKHVNYYKILDLNSYRGMMYGCGYAEAFEQVLPFTEKLKRKTVIKMIQIYSTVGKSMKYLQVCLKKMKKLI